MLTTTLKENRRAEFQRLFNCLKFPADEMKQNAKGSYPFDRHCEAIITMFSKRWNPSAQARISYEAQFSTQNWRALSIEIKQEHSLSSCIACSRNHLDLQQMFPGKPVFEATRIITLSLPSQVHTSNKQEKEEAELNAQWENRYDHTLTSALPRVAPQYNLTEKRKKLKQKKETDKKKGKFHDT